MQDILKLSSLINKIISFWYNASAFISQLSYKNCILTWNYYLYLTFYQPPSRIPHGGWKATSQERTWGCCLTAG